MGSNKTSSLEAYADLRMKFISVESAITRQSSAHVKASKIIIDQMKNALDRQREQVLIGHRLRPIGLMPNKVHLLKSPG